jgi:hypothetical protein
MISKRVFVFVPRSDFGGLPSSRLLATLAVKRLSMHTFPKKAKHLLLMCICFSDLFYLSVGSRLHISEERNTWLLSVVLDLPFFFVCFFFFFFF